MNERNAHFKDYSQDWAERAPGANRASWAKEYDKAFRADRKNFNWKTVQLGDDINLTTIQAEVWQSIHQLKEGRLLDVGCGNGRLVVAAHLNGVEAYGMDCSEDAIKFCKGHLDTTIANHFFTGDIADEGEDRYDYVICMEVLEHLLNPLQALWSLWQRVVEGGTLIVTVPKDGLIPSPYHLHEFSEKYMEQMIADISQDRRWKHSLRQANANWVLTLEKTPLDLAYAYVGALPGQADLGNERIRVEGLNRTGVYNWQRVFGGEAIDINKALQSPGNWEVLHVQISGSNFDNVRRIRKAIDREGADTKLVVNLDYALEVWEGFPPFPHVFVEQLRCADYLFASEPCVQNLMHDLSGKDIGWCPHPVDVSFIKEKAIEVDYRQNAVVMAHRDRQEYLPYWMLFEMGLETYLMGSHAPSITGVESGLTLNTYHPLLYDRVLPIMENWQALDTLKGFYLAIDAYTHHVFGRVTVELACLGIPTIGYDNVYAQGWCFPELTIRQGDIVGARQKVRALIEDRGFYEAIMNQGREQARAFNYESSKSRFLNMVEEDVYTRSSVYEKAQSLRLKAECQVAPDEPEVEAVSKNPVEEPTL